MKSVFQYEDYRDFLRDRFSVAPKGGYGQARRLAEALGVHTTLVSQIMNGNKSFTPEQAALVAEYLGLSDLETEFYVLLVQYERAGNDQLKSVLTKQMKAVQAKSGELVNRLKSNRTLSETERAQFYSDWIYSAIRQLVAIPNHSTAKAIAHSLDLPVRKVNEVLEFLLRSGLCLESKGRIEVGPQSTHLESSSPWVNSHHRNWRSKALNELSRPTTSSLHYTAPMTLSKSDALQIREMISNFLENVDKVVDPSPSEELHCLTIDWFLVQN